MPLDQASSATLTNLAHSFLRFLGEEAAEGHHPPNQPQHQQVLGGGGGDVNEPPQYPDPAKRAAGMLLMAPDGRALFVRRARNAGDHAGMWSIPGGMTEGDELPWQTAIRETQEETGQGDTGQMQLLDHNVMDGVGFTTFGGRVADNFHPQLNHEHDGFMWARPQDAPHPRHPGLQATLDFAQDPLTEKGSKIMSSMKQQYGPEKGERVFYASKNKGTISGVDDSYVTTGRQDTQIPRPVPVNPHIDNPFNANVDTGNTWASPAQPASQVMSTEPNSTAPPPSRPRRNTNDTWRSPLQDDSWASPRQDAAFTTRAKAMKPAAIKPVAATAGSKSLIPSRRGDAGGGAGGWGHQGRTPPTQGGANDLGRFSLYDHANDRHYALDKPLSADFTPFVAHDDEAQDAGGGAGGWGHGGLAPPTQPGAVAPDAPWAGGSTSGDPLQAPAGEGSRPPPLPRAGTGGGMRGGTSQGMPGGPMAMNGPKLTHSYKAQYADGSVDERKITRPGTPAMGMQPQGGMGQPQDAWASPQQPQQQQPFDAGWINASSLGQSPKGGRGGGARV